MHAQMFMNKYMYDMFVCMCVCVRKYRHRNITVFARNGFRSLVTRMTAYNASC